MQNNYAILMVRPAAFQYNTETAANNHFQKHLAYENLQKKVLREFDRFVEVLREHDIKVDVMQDGTEPVKPDAIFPNNWVAMLPDGCMTLFPMMAENRRPERNREIIEWIYENHKVNHTIDLSDYEQSGSFLEGTGSLVFDHPNKLVYAAISPRTTPQLATQYAAMAGYRLILFHAADANGKEIYHTNVLMAMGNRYCIICKEAIPDADERHVVQKYLADTGKEIINISFSQMEYFCGNALQVKDKKGHPVLICSRSAYDHYSSDQLNLLKTFNPVIPVEITAIETIGGGSARCMMAENYLEKIL